MYTSGTTGRSKGAVHNNRSSIHYIMPFVEGLDLGDDDVCYSMFPLFHQMGRSACTTAALWAGNRVELRAGFSASGFWDDVRRVRRDVDGLLRRRHPLPLAEPALAAATASTGSPARSARAPRRS